MKKLIRTNEGTDQDKWRNWSEQMKKLIRRVCLKTSFKGEWVNHVSQEALVKFFVNFLVAPTHCVHLKKVNFEAMHPKPYRSGGIRLRNNYIWPPCFWKFTWCCTKTNWYSPIGRLDFYWWWPGGKMSNADKQNDIGKKNKSHCGKNRLKNWPWKARSFAFSILSWTKW